MSIKYPLQYSLGSVVQDFPKVQYAKITEMIDAINKITSGTITLTDVELGNGTVALPSLTFASDLSTGLYRIGASEIGLTLAGVKSVDFAVNLTSFTGVVSASTSVLSPLIDTTTAVAMTIGTTATSLTINPVTTFSKAIIRKTTGTAINSTGPVTAAQIAGGLITSTSAAGTTITLDTATNLGTQLGAVQGTIFDFIV